MQVSNLLNHVTCLFSFTWLTFFTLFRYGLYDFEYEHQCQGTTESSKKQKLFLMSWCPDRLAGPGLYKVQITLLLLSALRSRRKCCTLPPLMRSKNLLLEFINTFRWVEDFRQICFKLCLYEPGQYHPFPNHIDNKIIPVFLSEQA